MLCGCDYFLVNFEQHLTVGKHKCVWTSSVASTPKLKYFDFFVVVFWSPFGFKESL
jgi:hypothetical protein